MLEMIVALVEEVISYSYILTQIVTISQEAGQKIMGTNYTVKT